MGVAMSAWEDLGLSEYRSVWEKFASEFQFRPSSDPPIVPGFVVPSPFEVYGLPNGIISDKYLNDLNTLFLKVFRDIVAEDGYLYALDWHHDSYRLYIHRHLDEWKISIYPDRDYHIFLSQDMSFGVIGHPWRRVICVFGEGLLDHVRRLDHDIFRSPIERSR